MLDNNKTSKLDQLRTMTSVVADTGDINAIKEHLPDDATTNPSLLLKAADQPEYQPIIKEAVAHAKSQVSGSSGQTALASDYLAVSIGREIASVVPGNISTEVDARLSFDSQKTIVKAQQLIRLYKQMGLGKDRILIKIAATWEGIRAAKELEQQGIRCNLTLLFSFAQALACAEAGIYLISPFVGRIYDWHKEAQGKDHLEPHEDPGVLGVKKIYQYYKQRGYKTVVMGASFRTIGQIEALAGCDKLTISPTLLAELGAAEQTLDRQLQPDSKSSLSTFPMLTESQFRWQMNEDPMATEKLAEGIRLFARDQQALEDKLSTYF